MNEPRTRDPVGGKEWLGWLLRTVICPLLGGIASWGIMRSTDWSVEVQIIVGLLAWWFWFRPVMVWLLAPIWNSLYVPVPALPTDSGIAEFTLYAARNMNTDFIRGLVGELLQYDSADAGNPVRLASGLPPDVEAKLEPKGTIKLRYSFEGYTSKRRYCCVYRNTPAISYKWPRYSYRTVAAAQTS